MSDREETCTARFRVLVSVTAYMRMKSVCVFCGSKAGLRPEYHQAAAATGKALAQQGIGLVYGAGSAGLMGVIARAVLAHGGEVIGVIPHELVQKEVPPGNLTELHVVASLQERKAMMIDLSDAFIALPGGFGTLNELLEVVTATQLRLTAKPCGLLNTAGYYDPFVIFLRHASLEAFIHSEELSILSIADDPVDLIRVLASSRMALGAAHEVGTNPATYKHGRL